jgi:hypothetical protein
MSFERPITLAFGTRLVALLTNEITWNAVLGNHVTPISLRPVKAYEPAGLSDVAFNLYLAEKWADLIYA